MVNQSDIFNTYPDENALDTVRRDSRPSSDAGEGRDQPSDVVRAL